MVVQFKLNANNVHHSALPLVKRLSKEHDLVLKTFRLLIADLCQQFNGGHPGYGCPRFLAQCAKVDLVLVVPLVWLRLVLHYGNT